MKEDKEKYSILDPRHYENPPKPPNKNIITRKNDKGEEFVTGIKPKQTGVWKFEYYFSPLFKAQLAKFMFIIVLTLPLVLLSVITMTHNISALIVLAICVLMLINTFLLYSGSGLGSFPAPQLLPLTWLVSKVPIKGYTPSLIEQFLQFTQQDEYLGPEERQKRAREIQKNKKSKRKSFLRNLLEENNENKFNEDNYDITVENNVSRENNPSPATILTNWMNLDEVQWDENDLHERAGGMLSRYDIKLLLSDNESIWKDSEKIDVLSKITGTNTKQWEEAYNKWKA